jgi:hypothetical protein
MSDRLHFDPIPAITVLNRHNVEYIIIGGIAAISHGSPLLTSDFDICYRRTPGNIERLVAALVELKARPSFSSRLSCHDRRQALSEPIHWQRFRLLIDGDARNRG